MSPPRVRDIRRDAQMTARKRSFVLGKWEVSTDLEIEQYLEEDPGGGATIRGAEVEEAGKTGTGGALWTRQHARGPEKDGTACWPWARCHQHV